MTTTSAPRRTPAGIPAGGQFTSANHSEAPVSLGKAADQERLYAAASTGPSEGRVTAAREAVKTHEAFLETALDDGDLQLAEDEAADDAKVLVALASLGELGAEERPHFGELLAVELVERAKDREQALWKARYNTERHRDREPEAQELAYDLSDPKHPGYVDRLTA